jgi:hypothetical protein
MAMQGDDPAQERLHRGPLPPYPADVDLVTWLEMSSQERADHIRRHGEKEGHSQADVERMIRFWDHNAALLAMEPDKRAAQVRHDMEKAWAGFGDEIERQTTRAIAYWDQTAAAAKERRAKA